MDDDEDFLNIYCLSNIPFIFGIDNKYLIDNFYIDVNIKSRVSFLCILFLSSVTVYVMSIKLARVFQ